MRTTRLAVVGCGRAAESLHLPAVALCPGVRCTVLVDRDESRSSRLASSYSVEETRREVADAVPLADAAVVALPHHLHGPVTRQLLEAGLHVLVEKPLALTANECEELAELARERGLTLAVGMIRRSFPAAGFVRQVLDRGLLGRIDRVELREGVPFSWDVASDFTFRRDTGGGVLADTGIHVLDLLAWWLGELEVTSYRDDAFGGVEANASIELRWESGERRTPGEADGPGERGVSAERPGKQGLSAERSMPGERGSPVEREGVSVSVELSRTRQLENCVTISGSRGFLVAGMEFDAQVRLELNGSSLVGGAMSGGRRYRNVRELFVEQLEDFVRALDGGAPRVDGRGAREAVRLMEECRVRRVPLRLPWLQDSGEVAA